MKKINPTIDCKCIFLFACLWNVAWLEWWHCLSVSVVCLLFIHENHLWCIFTFEWIVISAIHLHRMPKLQFDVHSNVSQTTRDVCNKTKMKKMRNLEKTRNTQTESQCRTQEASSSSPLKKYKFKSRDIYVKMKPKLAIKQNYNNRFVRMKQKHTLDRPNLKWNKNKEIESKSNRRPKQKQKQ